MTAYPEIADVERVFRQTAPQSAPFPAGNDTDFGDRDVADCDVGPIWRVVAADGSTSAINPPSKGLSEQPLDPQPTPSLDAIISEPSRASHGNIPMPAPAADCSKIPLADPTAWPSRPARAVLPPQTSARCRDIDSRLSRIIDAWPELPEAIRVAMMAMIDTVRKGK